MNTEFRSKLQVWIFSFVVLLCLAAIDSHKTYQISLLAFYLIPVGLVSWYSGKKGAIIISILATATWLICASISNHPDTPTNVRLWNAFMRLISFTFFGFSYASLRQALKNRESIIEELQRSLEQVKTLSGYLPSCPSCEDIRVDSGCWQDLRSYVKEQSNIEFISVLCPKCGRSEIGSETHSHLKK